MSYQSKFAGAQFVSRINEIARSKGIHLYTGTDFTEYAELVAKYRPDGPLGAPFDPTLHDLNQNNSFWIAGQDEAGNLVHTQAVRLIDIKQQKLSDYLAENFRDFPPGGVPLDMDASNYQAGPGATRISGRLAYHGEVWLKPGESSYRGTGIAAVLGRYAQAMAMMAWSPDYVFGFMPQSIAFGGFAEREGYVHSEPGALNWHHAETGKVMKGFLIYNERHDLDWMLEMPVQDLIAA